MNEAKNSSETVLGLVPKLLNLSTQYKELKYENESEWRLVLSFTSDEIKEFSSKCHFCELEIMNKSSNLLNVRYDWLGKIVSGTNSDDNNFLNKFENSQLRKFIASKLIKSKNLK